MFERFGWRRRGDAYDDSDVPVADRDDAAVVDQSYHGTNWGAAFFGWLVAMGMAALLTALLAAAGGAISLTVSAGEASGAAEELTFAGGILVVTILLASFYAGGYVAGRMSRFDGARQGFGVWIWAIVAAIVGATLGAVAGSEYNVFQGLNLPRIPVDEGDVTAGAWVALVVVLVGSLLAATAGGLSGRRYHDPLDATIDTARRNRFGGTRRVAH
jgi:hypothetical protein